jgi:tetratricopeptide (TPR) repeat protein
MAGLLTIFLAANAYSAEKAEIYRVQVPESEGTNKELYGTQDEILGYAQGFAERGNLNAAKYCYETLIDIKPGDARPYILLGRLYQDRMEQYVRAVKCYKKAEMLVSERTNPGGKALCQRLSAEAYRALAEKSNSWLYFVQAISEYEKILKYNPDDIDAIYNLASCRLNTQDYGRAIALYEIVLKKAPNSEWSDMSQQALKVARDENRQAAGKDRRVRRNRG